jgi:hypothetical protein
MIGVGKRFGARGAKLPRPLLGCTLALLMFGVLASPATATVTFYAGPSTDPWLGFMNVFNEPEDGGAYQFGSGWGIPDLVATFNDPSDEVRLSPNTIGDPNPYWYEGGGGPGADGNKIMEANLYVEMTDNALAGQQAFFNGNVLSNTFTSEHQTYLFIKDFAPDYSSFNQTLVPAVPGPFSISLMLDPGLGRHVQYGFQTVGVNVWATDVEPYGSVVIATPEPASLALLVFGGCAVLRRRR